MSATLKLEVPSDPRFLSVLRAVVGKVAEVSGLAGAEADELKLAVDEAMTNIIRHSLGNDYCRTIEVSMVVGKERLEVVLTDDGGPVDHVCLHEPVEPSPSRTGGVGVYLIHQCIDKVRYRRLSNNRNRLSLIKYLKFRPAAVNQGSRETA